MRGAEDGVRKKAKFIYLGYMLGFMTFMLASLFGLAFLGGEPVQTLSSAIGVVLLMTFLGTVIGFVAIDHMSFPEV
jgi:cadmium resistance protein CadD (predicted permease)